MVQIRKMLIIQVVIGVVLLPVVAFAESSAGFFQKNSPKNIFDTELIMTSPEDFTLLRKPRHLPQTQQLSIQQQADPTEADIISEFGNPGDDHPVLAIKDAPKPLKGLMKALQTKHEGLAFQYAKQYVRYLRDVQNRSVRVVGLTQLAMASEGMIDEETLPELPTVAADRHLLETDLKKQQEKAKQTRSYLEKIDPQIEKLLSKAEAELEAEADISPDSVDLNSEFEKNKIQRVLRSKNVPVDPEGKARVLFFMRMNNADALRMLPEVQKAAEQYSDTQGVQIRVLSMDQFAHADVDELHYKTGTSLPVESGIGLQQRLGIEVAPTTLVIAPSTGDALVEEGYRSFEYLHQVLKKVTGKGKRK